VPGLEYVNISTNIISSRRQSTNIRKILLILCEENRIFLHMAKKFRTFYGNLMIPNKTKKSLHFKQLVQNLKVRK
jgi:hypothetical protein